MRFDSMEQRMAHAYLNTMPPFLPSDDGPDASEQEAFYRMVERLYLLAYHEPQLFVKTLHEDDAYPNRFNRSSYEKPDIYKNMRKFKNEVDSVIAILFAIGKGEVPAKLSKRQSAILVRIGVDIVSPPSEAWRWMATRPGANLSSVSRCLFRMDGTPVSAVYARLLGDEKAFLRLEDWMLGRGYTRYVITDVAVGDDNLSLTYANLAWDTVPPKSGFEYGIRHTGVSMRYDAYVQNPPIIGLCIPKRLKACLGVTDCMNNPLKRFVVAHTKKCDACGYCVQTDKSGKRAKAYIPVEYNGKTHNLCTYFPGYGYCWTSLDNALVDNLTAMLEFMDDMLAPAPRRKNGKI